MKTLADIMNDIRSTTDRHDAELDPLISARDQEIIRLYTEEDETLMQIATRAGMDRSSISRILKRHDVPVYGRGRPAIHG